MTSSPNPEFEIELDVPIPGRILPEDQWVRTAIKKMPPPGPLDWQAIFGRDAPRVVDIGCGNGRFTLGSAVSRPDFDHIAMDILPLVIRYATRRGNQRGLSNTRWAVIGGFEFLENYAADRSLDEIHVYHPQPYFDDEARDRRLISPKFLLLTWQRLKENGVLYFQTDNPAYWFYFMEVAIHFFDLTIRDQPWESTPEGRTRREIQARQMGLPIFRAEARPKLDKQLTDLEAIVPTLSLPEFRATDHASKKQKYHKRRKPIFRGRRK